MNDLINRKDLMKKIAHHNLHDSLLHPTFETANVYEKVKGDMFRLVENEPPVDAIPRWISVEERLPEVEKCFDGYEHSAELLVYDGLRRRTAYYCHTSGVWYDSRYEDDTFEVTHWMQLPEQPKENA